MFWVEYPCAKLIIVDAIKIFGFVVGIVNNNYKPLNRAMFEWTMPKLLTDNRDRPLIIVWYDLIAVPYSLRPSLNDKWFNFTFNKLNEGDDLSLKKIFQRFKVAIWSATGLLSGFAFIMMIAFIVSDDKISNKDYMLDTRDIRTTYIHSVNTLVVPQSDLQSRSKFSVSKHGLWLVLVVAFRLVYMFVFTFIFFGYIFETINEKSFIILKQYNTFATCK